jgi:ketosteroid isomerase-like protein
VRRGQVFAVGGLVALLSACGAAPGTDAVTRAADQWLAAAQARDAAALCRLLTPAAAQSVVSGDETCRQAVGDLDLPGEGPVETVQVWSDRAQVRTGADTLFLTKVAGSWRVSGAGCTFRGDRPYDCDVEG